MIQHIVKRILCRAHCGLTIRNAVLLLKTAKLSNSRIAIGCKNRTAIAHNIFELLSLGMEYGDLVVMSACGEDAEQAVRNIEMLLVNDISNPRCPDILKSSAA